MTALAATAITNSQSVFGLLLASERGISLDRMADKLGCGADYLGALLDSARSGSLDRVPACEGTPHAVAESWISDLGEVLTKRWQRRLCRHLAQHGEINVAKVLELGGGAGDSCASIMQSLAASLKPLRIAVYATTGADRRQVWRLEPGHSGERLAKIIAADWRAAGLEA